MSFFGITALGPPNQFKSALVSALGINVFSEEEFKASFKRVDKDQSGYITADEVENFLFETYGFPPLEDEVSMFMQEFDTNQDGKVSWNEFSAALGRIKERVNQKATGAKEYKSFNKLRDDRYKHKRMVGEIQDKYKQPITFNQSIGFHH
jgi:Ca2+-binding EF-hand superfamily protein